MVAANEWDTLLKELNQSHLCEHAKKEEIYKQLDVMGPTELRRYIEEARKLLKASKEGIDPFVGFKASIPDQLILKPEENFEEFIKLESVGLEELERTVFVLVAGGLGERLGYNGIKIKLPTNTLDGKCYAQCYVEAILGMQKLSGKPDLKLPLFIMTSGDTHEKTMQLFEENNYFGADSSQIIIKKQEKVPALCDNNATIATDESGMITKPHGHGDVHALIFQNKLTKQWLKEGRKWLFFFQDTNLLAFRAILACIGTSKTHGFAMNSLCIPRLPEEAVGAICKLTRSQDEEITVNVEYNQLASLLGKDIAAEGSKYSAYPGNCNILTFNLEQYDKVLEKTGGIVPEFVNPKYKDSTKEQFKSPTRIECMMQEIARMFDKTQKVGCTVMDRWLCFSTVKNNLEDARKKQQSGNTAESPLTAEADLYNNTATLLRLACQAAKIPFEASDRQDATFAGIKADAFWPRVLVAHSTPCSLTTILHKLQANHVPKITLKNDREYYFQNFTSEELEGKPAGKLQEVKPSDSTDPIDLCRGYKPKCE